MRHAILVAIGITLFAAGAATQTKLGSAADEAAIIKNADARTAAFNRHDAKAIAALYGLDADRASAGGFFVGRAQVEKNFADGFNGVNKEATTNSSSQSVRFLTADVAILHREATVTGRTGGTVRNHATEVYVKRNGDWALVSQSVAARQP
jgi:uncharacterized protein (TIGR02246 family)